MCQNKLSYWVITRLLCSVQQNGQLNYGVVTSLPKSNSTTTTTRIQTASILTEFDENPDLKHAVGQPKRWELCWGFSVKVQTATNTLITGYLGGFWQQRLIICNAIASVAVSNGSKI